MAGTSADDTEERRRFAAPPAHGVFDDVDLALLESQSCVAEVWQTAKRLIAAGYERHEILHMLGSALTAGIWHVLSERRPDGRDRYLRALDALPESWEAQRSS